MIITDIRYHPYRVPFKRPFTTAHGTLMAREGVIVELVTDAGVSGYGDMAAVTEFGAPDVATLIRAAREVEPEFRGQRFSAQTFMRMLFPLLPALAFALERAFYDALVRGATTRSKQNMLFSHYGDNAVPPQKAIAVNATVSAPSISEALSEVRRALEAHYGCIKLKVGMLSNAAAEVTRIRAIAEAIGPIVHLRLDANEAWGREEADTILHALADCRIQYIEQPLMRDDLAGMQWLRGRVNIPIAADEALSDIASVQRVWQAEAADVLIIKPQLLGGLSTIMQILMTVHGMPPKKQIVLTTSLESGIGVAATHAIAQLFPPLFNGFPILLECGLATLPLLEDDLIIEKLPIRGGYMFGASTPMQRVTPDFAALVRYRLEVDGL